MDVRLPTSSSSSESHPTSNNNEDFRRTMPQFSDDAARRDWLIEALGETTCRKLGLFPIPETLTLSVVIPVYDERSHDPRNPAASAGRPDQEADHRGRRLLAGRHSRDPARARKDQRRRSEGHLPGTKPGEGGCASHRLPPRHRRHRHRAGCRSRIRARAVSRAHPADRRATRPTSSSARGSSARPTACSISGIRWRTSSSRCSPTCSRTLT